MLIGSQLLGFSRGGCVLDTLSSGVPAAVGALRRMTAKYTGPLINVRRDSDNSSIDIGCRGNILDIWTLQAFCGSANGFVTTLYNHGTLGSAGDMTMPYASYQPRIVNAGVVETLNGRPTMNFGFQFNGGNGTPTFFNVPAAVSPVGGSTGIFVLDLLSQGQENGLFFIGGGYSSPYGAVSCFQGSDNNLFGFNNNQGGYCQTSGGVSSGNYVFTQNSSSGDSSMYLNGSIAGSSTTDFTITAGAGRLGEGISTPYFNGSLSEVLFTSGGLMPRSDQSIVERNCEAFYGISGI